MKKEIKEFMKVRGYHEYNFGDYVREHKGVELGRIAKCYLEQLWEIAQQKIINEIIKDSEKFGYLTTEKLQQYNIKDIKDKDKRPKKDTYNINQQLRAENKRLKKNNKKALVICSDTKLKPIDKITPIYNILINNNQ